MADKGNLNEGMGDDYMVAADLTLYANPLRILNRRSRPAPQNQSKAEGDKKTEKSSTDGGDKQDKVKKEDREIIAADLTKYGSPLDDRQK